MRHAAPGQNHNPQGVRKNAINGKNWIKQCGNEQRYKVMSFSETEWWKGSINLHQIEHYTLHW